ncbi:MAG: hypothetical protein ACRC0V_02620, partial [Fusobacteriaceae bacterium]
FFFSTVYESSLIKLIQSNPVITPFLYYAPLYIAIFPIKNFTPFSHEESINKDKTIKPTATE